MIIKFIKNKSKENFNEIDIGQIFTTIAPQEEAEIFIKINNTEAICISHKYVSEITNNIDVYIVTIEEMIVSYV